MAVETMTIAGCRVKIVRIDRPEYERGLLRSVWVDPADVPKIKKAKR